MRWRARLRRSLERVVWSIGFLVGFLPVLVFAHRFGSGAFAPFGIALVIYGAEGWIASWAHELGHAAAAALTGRRIHAIAVFPLLYRPRTRKWTIYEDESLGIVGFVLATPAPGRSCRSGERLYLAGGVLANFLAGGLALRLGWFFPAGHLAVPFLTTFALVSLVVGIFNLLPLWGPGLRRTDGAALIDNLRGRPMEHRDRLRWLQGMEFDGVDPKNWDAGLIRQVESDLAAGQASEPAYRLLYLHYMARHEFERAGTMLVGISNTASGVTDWMRIELAFLLAMAKDGRGAMKWLDELGRGARRGFRYWRALALAEHRIGDVCAAADAADSARLAAEKEGHTLDSIDIAIFDAIDRRAPIPGAVAQPITDEHKAGCLQDFRDLVPAVDSRKTQ
jgi:hypothetical protein